MASAQEAGGGEALGEARFFLEESCTKSAASALLIVAGVAKSCEKQARSAVKAAERAVRDLLVIRCRSRAVPEDRRAFLLAAEQVFGGKLETQLRAVLLLAFHKVPTGKSETVLSNSQLDAALRKRKRPRGQRGGRRDAAATSATISEEETERAGVGSSSLMSSSMHSTLPRIGEPRVGP